MVDSNQEILKLMLNNLIGNAEKFNHLFNQVFKGDIRSICRLYYQSMMEAVETGWFSSVGHLDVIKKRYL